MDWAHVVCQNNQRSQRQTKSKKKNEREKEKMNTLENKKKLLNGF